MDNSKFIKYDKFLFNVTGEIEDPQPKLDNKNLILMLNVENNETSEIQVQCYISNITRNNYILNCKANETFQGIIVSILVAVALVTFLIFHFNKKNKKEVTLSSDSSAYAFKVADGIKYLY